jgi:hypothetical protein
MRRPRVARDRSSANAAAKHRLAMMNDRQLSGSRTSPANVRNGVSGRLGHGLGDRTLLQSACTIIR